MKIAKWGNGFDNRGRMESYRFYIADLLAQTGQGGDGGVVRLPEGQGHHARAVLRLAGGERLVVLDGKGAGAAGVMEGEAGAKLSKRAVEVRLEGGVRVD